MRARLLLTLLTLVPAALLPQAAAASNGGTDAKIVFARDMGAGNHDIFVANADGSNAVNLTNNVYDDVDPSVSPDGTRIAFSSNRGGSYDIFVMNIGGSTPLRLTGAFGSERDPTWAPSGNTIAYASLPLGGATGWDIWTMAADGSLNLAKSSQPGDERHPAYSPDGMQVAWSNGTQIWGAAADFGGPVQLIASSTVDGFPTWSPDSTRLAWKCGNAICMWGTDGYTITTISASIAGLAALSWSHDGNYVLYNDNTGVKRVNIDGSNPVSLTSQPGDAAGDWAPGLANVRIPAVAGSFTLGGTLVADSGVWVGSSGIAYAYQWKRCNTGGGNGCNSIPGATGQHYTATVTDLNATLRVFVTATSAAGSATASSAPTPTITNAVVVGPPTIVSTALTIGSTVAATTGSVGSGLGPAPLSFTFVWERCDTTGNMCSPIVGATGPSYVITTLDSGHTLRVIVTAANSSGSAAGTSAQTAVVGGLAPVNGTIPVIAGTPVIGGLLVATSGVWTGGAGLTYSYQWKRCDASGANCLPIPGATATSYNTLLEDAGFTLLVTVTATNSFSSIGADSLPTVIVGATPVIPGPGAPASTVAPRVVGTPAIGSAFTATTGGFVGAGNTYAFQWQRCDTRGLDCESITGATSRSYILRQPDLGSTIRVVVTAKNAVGSASAYSDVSSVIAPAPAGGSSSRTQSVKALTLTGTAHADRLVVTKGKSRVVAGAGNDVIFAADGRREVIDCGPGRDTVTADRFDVLLHCERVIYPKKKRLAATR